MIKQMHFLGLVLFMFAMSPMCSLAQQAGIYASPAWSGALLTASDHNQAFDSIRDMSKPDLRWNLGVSTHLELNREWDIELGVQVSNLGFSRIWEDLQYLDSIHPAIGRVEDLSDNGMKIATYEYYMRYITLPVLFHYDLRAGRRTAQYGGSLYVGPAFSLLIREQQNIRLTGFTVKGSFKHELETTDYDLARFQAAICMGGRYIWRVEKRLFASFQPGLSIHIPVSGKDETLAFRLIQLFVQAGLYYEL